MIAAGITGVIVASIRVERTGHNRHLQNALSIIVVSSMKTVAETEIIADK